MSSIKRKSIKKKGKAESTERNNGMHSIVRLLSEKQDIIFFYRTHRKAVIPKRATPGSVGYDLFTFNKISIPPRRVGVLVNIGIRVIFPPNSYGRIAG